MNAIRPVFLCLPAMGVGGRFYQRFAQALEARTGGTAFACNLLSSGGARRVAGEFGYREIVEHEIPALVARTRRRHPRRPVVLCGHSLGGQLGLLACGLMPQPPDALVLIAAGTAHHRAWPADDRRAARIAVELITLAARMLPWYPGDRLGFGGDQPRRLMRDWAFNAASGRYRLEGSALDEAALRARVAALRTPVLSVGLFGDLVAPEGAQEELLAHAPRADITRLYIDGEEPGGRWQRHFGWARDPAAMAQAIAAWTEEVLAKTPREMAA